MSGHSPSDENDAKEYFKHLRHSAPGPDGLPYAAWIAGGDRSAKAVIQVTDELRAGNPPPDDLCFSFQILPPKGSKKEDSERVVRLAEETRPLNLKDSINKVCTGLMNDKITAPIARWAHRAQRGFTKHRQGLDNVVDIDTTKRIVDMECRDAGSLGVLALYDFMTAFPSVVHLWMFLCLEAAGFPSDVTVFFKMIY